VADRVAARLAYSKKKRPPFSSAGLAEVKEMASSQHDFLLAKSLKTGATF
jgi:hypothetical protein